MSFKDQKELEKDILEVFAEANQMPNNYRRGHQQSHDIHINPNTGFLTMVYKPKNER